MAWKLPTLREVVGYIVDVDSWNENFRWANDEISGYLNEHNWANNAITSATNMEAGSVIKIISASQAVNPDIGFGNPPPTVLPAGGYRIPNSFQWEVITILDTTVETADTIVHHICTFQCEPSNPAAPSNKYGVQFALAIDDNVINETIIGSVDKPIDPVGEGFGDLNMGEPLVVESIDFISAGTHRFTCVARLVDNATFVQVAVDDYYMILNREQIIIELW